MNETVRPHPIVVMGVAGSGRTAVGSALGEWLAEHTGGGVVSCSALKVDYRDLLRAHAPDVTFLHLAGHAGVVTARVAARTDHFMPASLVSSQLELLEPLWADEAGMVADLTRSLDELVDELSTLFRGSAAAVATGGTR
jgi:gluconokinase